MAEALKSIDARMHDRMSTTSGLIALMVFAALAVSCMVYALASALVRVVPSP